MRIAQRHLVVDQRLPGFPGLDGRDVLRATFDLVKLASPRRWIDGGHVRDLQLMIRRGMHPITCKPLLETDTIEKFQIGLAVLGAADTNMGRRGYELTGPRHRGQHGG